MNRKIRKVAVLGSGIMGSGIACHFANIGIEVLLLDIIPGSLTDKELKNGLTLQSKEVRNRIVNEFLETAVNSKPAPLYKKEFSNRISTGNFTDDLEKISTCDWIIEVVIEKLDIKKQVFENVEKFRKPGTLITSNTSGISVEQMIEARTDDFKQHFCGTHFFNPPRYLKLFEIIPSSQTKPEIIEFLNDFALRFLGKTPVVAKNTPAFIANRIGTFSIMHLFNNVRNFGLNVTEIDKLTGTLIGRAKSATFRTADIVGIDTLMHVAGGLKYAAKDEQNEAFAMPDYIKKMLETNKLGEKSKQGFFKKVSEGEKKKFFSIDFDTLEYKEDAKPEFDILNKTKEVDDLGKRVKILCSDTGKVGNFYKKTFFPLFAYSSNRIPEISDELFKVDDALNAGFGWKLGPFETWDALGVRETIPEIEKENIQVATWVKEMLENGCETFYKIENSKKLYYDIPSKRYKEIPGKDGQISLQYIKQNNTVWQNEEASIINIGDGVLNLEFHSKMNVIGGGTLQAIIKAVELAENEYKALVISNEADNFSAGANVGMIYMMALEQDFDELNYAVSMFQNTMMRLRYSAIPVVAAPHGLTLGGGCELCMHADKVIAHAETYMGLVEFGVGLIPGGGGTKEFALRLSDELKDGDIRTNAFINRYLTIGQAKVSTSANEAFDLGYLRKGTDEVILNKDLQLAYAKQTALLMVEKGYSQPAKRNDIKVMGKEAHGLYLVGADSFTQAGYMSEHDKLIAEKLGFVLSGGNISKVLTEVTEQYLLDLERKAFLELCMQAKTLERMQSLVTKSKILRN